MKSLSKLFFLVLLVFLSTTSVQAQEAFPKVKFPCDQVNDPEFHSLRPYQAAVCGDADKALFCSNDLKFIESFDLTNQCDLGGNTSDFWCKPKNGHINPHNLYVELTDSMFPIMGNTEQVKNSQEGTEEFSDAQKVNEYASWYLSGVNNKAEYGESTEDRVVNFSGPIQKLLPKLIQEAERIDTIKKAIVNEPYVDEDTGETITEPQNHNQIVVCSKGNDATPCPEGDKLRLSDWGEGNLSVVNTFFNWIGTDVWNYKYPPLPWQFSEQILYQKAYNEWQGKNCAILPIVGLQCLNTWVSNKWANLYQYIPLSNTTDKKGAENILGVQIEASTGTTKIANDGYNVGGQKNAPLYFAHTEEVKELSNLLNKTYTPADYESEPLPKTTEKLPQINGRDCSAVNVRTNKGDNLFPGDRSPGDTKEIIIPGVTYDITQVLCKVTKKEVCIPYSPPKKGCFDEIIYTYSCNAEVTVTVKTGTKTPNADEIFSTTVADSGSTFRKIFPKVGEGSPVTCIADIPTVTGVTYNAEESEIPTGGSLEFQVKKYPEDGGGNTPELTFPHVGSVYEYFLKGIQTALRPKGYGEPITDGVLCQPETQTGTCKQWLFEKDKGGKFYYDKVIQAASSTSCDGKKLNPFWAIAIALNENGGLMSDEIEGKSSSHFGCNISQIQSIEEKISCMANTLRNDCLAGKTDEQTLQEYGYAPGFLMWPITVLAPGSTYPPPLFGTGFNVSQLTSNLLNTNWVEVYQAKAPIFCPNSPTLSY